MHGGEHIGKICLEQLKRVMKQNFLFYKRPKEKGLRYALLVYEKREIGDLWVIANKIADREWDRRKKGLTSAAFDNAVLKDFNKFTPEEKSRRKRYTQSKLREYENEQTNYWIQCVRVFP